MSGICWSAITVYTHNATGAQGSLFHMLNHGLMKGLAFLAAGSLLYALHVASGSHKPLVIADLNGAAQRYPLAALGLSVAVLGLGGLPPLAGFMSKWQIFAAGFETRETWIEVLIVFAALNSVLSLAYYAPLVNAVYRQKPSEAVLHGEPLAWQMNVPVIVLSAAVIVIRDSPGCCAGWPIAADAGCSPRWVVISTLTPSPHQVGEGT